MSNKNSKQIYITSFGYPIDSIGTFIFSNKAYDLFCAKKDFHIKKFLGSDWTIIGSGFILSGPKDLNVVFTVSNFEKNDFNVINIFTITYLNGNLYKNNKNEIVLSLIRNTTDNTTIMECKFEFEKESDLLYIQDFIDFSTIKKMFSNFCHNLKLLISISKNSLSINQSFIIRNNYKEAFNFFYNWNNYAKSLKTDKIWKIINENEEQDNKEYKNYSIIINEKIKIHYRVISIEEKQDEKIEIVYRKTGNSYPALNEYIKLSFFNIEKDLCFFLYNTQLPLNINSSMFQICSNFLFYCNKKCKKFFGSKINNS